MLHRILSTIISIMACVAVCAQDACIINGYIANSQLSNGKKIKKLYLTRTNELGKEIEIAEAKVKKGKYTFKHNLAQNEPVMQYTIKGFDEGEAIKLFVEPGEVTINTAQATQASKSSVTGTPTNNIYNEYKAILDNRENEVAKEVAALEERGGTEWLASSEGQKAVKRLKAKEAIKTESQVLRFIIDHNDSPVAALETEQSLLPVLSTAYAEQAMKAISTTLHNHPYYHSLRNKVLSNNMRVGNEVPNIALPLNNGQTTHIADYKGKYVVLNFWANDSAKSAEMFTELQKLHELVKGKETEFVIISFALESDITSWKEAVESKGIDREGWLHACDGVGTESPAAKLYKVESTPQIILIEPEGHAVSLNMEIDELVMRAEQILSGDLYYLDNQEE